MEDVYILVSFDGEALLKAIDYVQASQVKKIRLVMNTEFIRTDILYLWKRFFKIVGRYIDRLSIWFKVREVPLNLANIRNSYIEFNHLIEILHTVNSFESLTKLDLNMNLPARVKTCPPIGHKLNIESIINLIGIKSKNTLCEIKVSDYDKKNDPLNQAIDGIFRILRSTNSITSLKIDTKLNELQAKELSSLCTRIKTLSINTSKLGTDPVDSVNNDIDINQYILELVSNLDRIEELELTHMGFATLAKLNSDSLSLEAGSETTIKIRIDSYHNISITMSRNLIGMC